MSLTEAILTESGEMRGLEAASNRVREDYVAPEVEVLLWKGVGTLREESATVPTDLITLDVSWYYDWINYATPGQDAVPSTPGIEFVPMVWGDWELYSEPGPVASLGPADIMLGFNEPDVVDQSNITVARALELWPDMEASGARLGSPAPGGSSSGLPWLASFMAGDPQVDFICLHWYPQYDSGFADIGDFLDHVYGLYSKPIWLTEVGSLGTTVAANAAMIDSVIAALQERPWVERVAWFFSARAGDHPASTLINSDGSLNAAGTEYASYPDKIPHEEPEEPPVGGEWDFDFTDDPDGVPTGWTTTHHLEVGSATVISGVYRCPQTWWQSVVRQDAVPASTQVSIKGEFVYSATGSNQFTVRWGISDDNSTWNEVQFNYDGTLVGITQTGFDQPRGTWTPPAVGTPTIIEVVVNFTAGCFHIVQDGVRCPMKANFTTIATGTRVGAFLGGEVGLRKWKVATVVGYSDNFNRPDSVRYGGGVNGYGLGSAWQNDTFQIVSQKARKQEGNDFARCGFSAVSTDHWAEADVSAIGQDYTVVHARASGTPGQHCYMAVIAPYGAIYLGKNVDNLYSDISSQGPNIAPSGSGRLRIEVEGVAQRVYWNDTLVNSATDASHATGTLTGMNVSGINTQYDNFRCGPLPYTPP